jgi:exonuclease SbcC
MQLILKNFRCYEEKTFEFGEQGLVLLSGGSGRGKSTILMAIDFALFGSGTKIIMHGKKSCSVELTFQKLKIVRKKGPNHLLVNDCYEDDAGEAVIKDMFGQIFNSVSYIPQNPRKTFVLLSPAERLDFLETFAFKDFDIVGLKEKAKSVIKEANEQLLKTAGSIRYATQMLEQKPKPENKPFFVPGIKKKENIEKYIQNEAVKLKNSVTILKTNEKKVKQLYELIQKMEMFKMKLSEREKTKLSLEKNKAELELEKEKVIEKEKTVSKVSLLCLEMRLQKLLRNKDLVRMQKTFEENEEKLQRLILQEEEELKAKIKSLQHELDDNPTEDELQNEIIFFTELISKKKELEKAEKDIACFEKDKQAEEKFAEVKKKCLDTRLQLDRAKLEKEKLKCPHCQNAIRLVNGSIIKFAEERDVQQENMSVHQTMEQLQAQLTKLTLEEKAMLPKLENQKKYYSALKRKDELLAEILEMNGVTETIQECETQQEEFKALLSKLQKNEQELVELRAKLTKKQYSTTISLIQRQQLSDKKKLEQLRVANDVITTEGEKKEEEAEDEEALRQKINSKKQLHEQVEFFDKLVKKAYVELQDLEEEINNLHVQIKAEKPLSSLRVELNEAKQLIDHHEARKKDLELFFKKVLEWKQNQKDVEEYDNLFAEVELLKEKEMEQKKKYTASCEFRDNILEAESIFVSNVIDNVNNNVQLYLEHFFPDHPITVRLSSFKENMKNETKPSIHLEIDYKGMEMDLSMLSGGEVSRVILSFTLAFADLYNSPLILLDECTSSLDQDLTTSVLEGLKEHFGSKLCLIVAHQVVKGAFDKVITL